MNFIGYGAERSYLIGHLSPTVAEREDLTTRAQELAREGKTQREIAAALGISASTVNHYLKTLSSG